MRLFRRRFSDLVERQLDLFALEQADRLQRIAAAHARMSGADESEAEESYGDYQDEVDWAAEDLVELRDGYAATLDPATARDYSRAFLKAARRRFPSIAAAVILDETWDER